MDSPFKDEDLIRLAQEFKEKRVIYIDHHKRESPKDLAENLIYFDVRALKPGEISTSGVVYRIGREIFGEEFQKIQLDCSCGSNWGLYV